VTRKAFENGRIETMIGHYRSFVAGSLFAVMVAASVETMMAQQEVDLSGRLYYEPNCCGPIALCCICKGFGIDASLNEIVRMTGFRGRPVSVAAIVQTAEAKGLKAEAWDSSIRHLERMGGTAIIDYPRGHFAVFLGWKGGKARILDSPHPEREVTVRELREAWGRHLITFQRRNVKSDGD
jgi:ABC-type bacteriocin/lantibiotic exporter with double-glycine peptidase domain